VDQDQEPPLRFEKQVVDWLKTEMPRPLEEFGITERVYDTSIRKAELFRQFAGCKVDVTDEAGNSIAVGTMDEHGLIRYEIDGVEHTKQLSHLVVGEE
jgi:hypothetical protein